METIQYLIVAMLLAACVTWLYGLVRCWWQGRLHTLLPLVGLLPILGSLVFLQILPAANVNYAMLRLLVYLVVSLLVLGSSQSLFGKLRESEQATVVASVYYQYAITYSIGLMLAFELAAWVMWR